MNHAPVSNLKVGIYGEFAPRTDTGRLDGRGQGRKVSASKQLWDFFESINRSF